MTSQLEQLYESTAEDLRYGIGTLVLPDLGLVPCIQVHYPDWSREKLDIVRQSFAAGLILVGGQRPGGTIDLYIGTRETITLQAPQDGHTDVLRAPACDAHLANVDANVFKLFDAERQRFGGFLLLVSTPAGEFLTVVDERQDRILVGVVLPPSGSMPFGQATN